MGEVAPEMSGLDVELLLEELTLEEKVALTAGMDSFNTLLVIEY